MISMCAQKWCQIFVVLGAIVFSPCIGLGGERLDEHMRKKESLEWHIEKLQNDLDRAIQKQEKVQEKQQQLVKVQREHEKLLSHIRYQHRPSSQKSSHTPTLSQKEATQWLQKIQKFYPAPLTATTRHKKNSLRRAPAQASPLKENKRPVAIY